MLNKLKSLFETKYTYKQFLENTNIIYNMLSESQKNFLNKDFDELMIKNNILKHTIPYKINIFNNKFNVYILLNYYPELTQKEISAFCENFDYNILFKNHILIPNKQQMPLYILLFYFMNINKFKNNKQYKTDAKTYLRFLFFKSGIKVTNKQIDKLLNGDISFIEMKDYWEELSLAKNQEEFNKIQNDIIC